MPTLLLLTVFAFQPADFDTDVLPLLTKAGCNAAACHGAASGRGGFKLSLFAGDPAADFRAIVRERQGRRVNLAKPERSLVFLKPTWNLEHEGGMRFTDDSSEGELLLRWITEGAQRRNLRSLTSLAVDTKPNAEPNGWTIQAVAGFSDGETRDVSSDVVYTPDDPAATAVDKHGGVTVLRGGRHTIAVRYLSMVKAVQITSPLHAEKLDVAGLERSNWIDDEINAALAELRISLSPQATDAELLRRLRLDLTGRLPSLEETKAYLADESPDKYLALAERLLASGEFNDYWTYRLASLLRIRTNPQEKLPATTFHLWLRQQLADETGWDEIATAMLTAEGDSHSVGPANFHRASADARAEAEYVSETLLGVRMRCANCHNHPLDRWTQDDYHGLAAVFAPIQRGRVISFGPRGEVSHPVTGEAAVPRIPATEFLSPHSDNRPDLAAWLTAERNPYFAKAAVNRIWKALMGRGLVEPVDDLRATNPATHPELLDRLATDFAQHGYNFRRTMRLIVASAAYQRGGSSLPLNTSDDRFYSRALPKPMTAEVWLDAISDVTGVHEFPAKRAVTLFDTAVRSESLDTLGRCDRQDSCESAEGGAQGVAAKLSLINGPVINAKVESPKGRLSQLIQAGATNEQIVETFYLAALARPPAEAETAFWKTELAGDDRRQKLQDFVWGLITASTFAASR